MKKIFAADSFIHKFQFQPFAFRSLPRREAGQSMLEVALCLPIFFILILGTAEIASIAWSAVQVQNAARAGAQFGAQSRAAASDTTDITTAAKRDAPALTTMTVTPNQSCQCINTSTGATAGSGCATITECPSPYVIIEQIQVNTSAAVTPLFHLPGLPASYTLAGQAIMDVEK
ncbi:MAG TPA: TadE/TadG family type IV pilus assembly protein [Acidobacteriaceae bacterium]|jgi:Flp pilus assembly protein TadG|nr:TadE/TadG family type IV pilus assembly protein [Acidobacteriaceae bacterium]